jgi:hypothetical protein
VAHEYAHVIDTHERRDRAVTSGAVTFLTLVVIAMLMLSRPGAIAASGGAPAVAVVVAGWGCWVLAAALRACVARRAEYRADATLFSCGQPTRSASCRLRPYRHFGRRTSVGRFVGLSELEPGGLDQLDGNPPGPDVVCHEQLHELLAVDEPDERLVVTGGLFAGALTEVTGRDDQTLLMRLEASV